MKCGSHDFRPLPLFWFSGEIINIQLQDSGMLEGTLRFLLEHLLFLFLLLLLWCHDFSTIYVWEEISWEILSPLGIINMPARIC